jgi:hypothetical protein
MNKTIKELIAMPAFLRTAILKHYGGQGIVKTGQGYFMVNWLKELEQM